MSQVSLADDKQPSSMQSARAGDAAKADALRRPARPEFLLNQTLIVFSKDIKPIVSSEGRGWSDIVGAVVHTPAQQGPMPADSSLWLSMALSDVDVIIERQNRGGYQGVIPQGVPFVTAPGIANNGALLNAAEFFHVFIKEGVLAEVADELYGKRLGEIEILSPERADDKGLAHILHACRHMLTDVDDSSWRSDYIARTLAAQVFTRHSQLREIERLRDSRVPLSSLQMLKVRDYLEANLHGGFQMAELAASIGMSRTTFFERFIRTMNATPNQYLQGLRVNKAKALIGNHKLSLVDIAFACGYADQAHFARFFKRFVGVSPGRYRKEAS